MDEVQLATEHLWKLSNHVFAKSPNLARFYGEQIGCRVIESSVNLQYRSPLTLCPHCDSLLVPGVSCVVDLTSRKSRSAAVLTHLVSEESSKKNRSSNFVRRRCLACGWCIISQGKQRKKRPASSNKRKDDKGKKSKTSSDTRPAASSSTSRFGSLQDFLQKI